MCCAWRVDALCKELSVHAASTCVGTRCHTTTQIDTWDAETAYFYVSDVLEWQRTMSSADGDAVCGSSTTNHDELVVPVKMTFAHYGQTATFLVNTSLDSSASDESWGIANFKVTTSVDNCTAAVYTSDFASEGTGGWIIQKATSASGITTTCGTHAVLGGYNDFGVAATATRDVELGSAGHGVIVAFTYLKVRCRVAVVAFACALLATARPLCFTTLRMCEQRRARCRDCSATTTACSDLGSQLLCERLVDSLLQWH